MTQLHTLRTLTAVPQRHLPFSVCASTQHSSILSIINVPVRRWLDRENVAPVLSRGRRVAGEQLVSQTGTEACADGRRDLHSLLHFSGVAEKEFRAPTTGHRARMKSECTTESPGQPKEGLSPVTCSQGWVLLGYMS